VDQRLIAALGYLFTPVVPLVTLNGDLKEVAALRRHARQALYWSPGFLALLVLAVIFSIALIRLDFLAICLLPLLIAFPFVPGGWWAWKVYSGKEVIIPLLTPLARRDRT
jgi:hypothetical protein